MRIGPADMRESNRKKTGASTFMEAMQTENMD